MKLKKCSLSIAIGLAIGGASLSSQAALTGLAVLVIDSGQNYCVLDGTFPNCAHGVTNVTTGSWFSLDTNRDGIASILEKTGMLASGGSTSSKGIGLTITQTFDNTGNPMNSHTGGINGTENPQVDLWEYLGSTGMHYLTSPITDLGTDTNGDHIVDMSGWALTWNALDIYPMGGDTANFPSDTGIGTMSCSVASCSFSSTFTLTYDAHVPINIDEGGGGAAYSLHLEGVVGANGTISNPPGIPVPASAWLFGSGLVGLIGIARRKKA